MSRVPPTPHQMPTQPSPDRSHGHDTIVDAIRAYADGITLMPLLTSLNAQQAKPISRRTLSRRLATLEALGRVTSNGQTTAARYFVSESTTDVSSEKPEPERAEGLTVSPAGAEVRSLVRQPKLRRPPVGYQQSFLRDYLPGTTWYLTPSMRLYLHTLGRTSDSSRPAGTFAHDIFERLLIDLSWASSRLEGNTYSRLDTENLLAFGVRAEGKDAAEAQMLLNHKKAIEMLVDQADVIQFNRYTILNLHAALAENLLDDAKDEGRVRTRLVGITGTTFVPLSIPQQLEELLELLLMKASLIPDAFEQAFFVMVHLPYLQPFIDVNKRTSRLAANIPLIQANFCPLSFIDVVERDYVDGTLGVYEFNRVELLRDVFLWAYERSCAQYRVVRDSLPQPDPIRLRYRQELAEIVHEFVISGAVPERNALMRWAAQRDLARDDQAAFADTALALLINLHEGSSSRYGLGPSEFRAWSSRFRT